MVYQVSATPFHVVEPSAGQNLTDGNHSFKHSNVIPLFKGAQGVTHKRSNVFLHLKVFTSVRQVNSFLRIQPCSRCDTQATWSLAKNTEDHIRRWVCLLTLSLTFSLLHLNIFVLVWTKKHHSTALGSW